MKKLLVYTLLLFYLVSYLKPYIPVMYQSLSHTIWKASHQYEIKKLDARANLLEVLADMAKHNNPQKDSSPQSDSFKQSASCAAVIIPKTNTVFCASTSIEKQFENYHASVSLFFKQLNTPPPKFS